MSFDREAPGQKAPAQLTGALDSNFGAIDKWRANAGACAAGVRQGPHGRRTACHRGGTQCHGAAEQAAQARAQRAGRVPDGTELATAPRL